MTYPVSPGWGNLPNGAFSPVIYSQMALKSFRKVSVIPAVTNTDYFGEIANYGDSVRIIKEPDVAIQPYSRGQGIVISDLLDEDTTLYVDKGNTFAFQMEDVEAKQTHIDWLAMAADKAAYKIRDAYDTEVLSYMASNAGVTTSLGTTGSPTTVKKSGGTYTPLDVLAYIAMLFDKNNIPVEDRAVIAPPDFWYLLSDENNKLLDAKVTGDPKSQIRTGLYNGKMVDGLIRNFSCYQSNNLPSAGTGPLGTTSSNYGSLIACHKSAVATASQIAKTENFRSPTTFADVVRGLHIYGRKVLRSEALAVCYWNQG